MVFVDVCRAVYDYAPQSAEELEIKEGDLLFILEKSSDDDWWKCKKKAASDDDEEPEGLVPNNYVESIQPLYKAKALYDYTRQTDEELSFRDEERLDVFDDSDPDWTLVGGNGEYGFAPAIYIEKTAATAAASAPSASAVPAAAASLPSPPRMQRELAAPPPMPSRPMAMDEPLPGEADYPGPDPGMAPTPSPEPAGHNPAAALAGIIAQRTGGGQPSSGMDRGLASPPLPSRPQYTPEESEEDLAPPMPQRPRSEALPSPPPTQHASSRFQEPPGVQPSPPYNRHTGSYSPAGFTPADDEFDNLRSPGAFHLYNVHEMISHMGKNKKMPTTLGINIARGMIMISPEKSRDGPSQEWSAEKLTHYSIEGKHVFVELVRPSKSVDFHAGAKDTAQEIVAQLGDLAGAVRQEGLREVLAASSGTAGSGQKKGKMLYEFMAQGEDEVTVAVDDEVIVLDDRASEEWWKVRRMKNGKEGVVPSSYVEITGTLSGPNDSISGLNAARSTVDQNRAEEERLARQAAKDSQSRDSAGIPERESSLAGGNNRRHGRSSSNDQKRPSKDSGAPKSKPNLARIRTWTDRSGTFKVEAEFIGLRDGKIHLHKNNGVKIAVPVSKMAVEDLEYVEAATGKSLDEDKPLSEIKRQSTMRKKEADRRTNGTGAGATIQKESGYDWFDFFLSCGVNPQICERYASAFSRDQMGPEVLPDVNEQLLRTLGLKEGDILRVMKSLDAKYGRAHKAGAGPLSPGLQQDDSIAPVNGGGSGLLSGPGGALRNNTRKGRPAPPIQTNDVVDESAFKHGDGSAKREIPSEGRATALAGAPARHPTGGFDDDAWDVKPARTQAAAAVMNASAPVAEPPKAAPAPQPKMNDDLALLAMPLQPTATGAAPASFAPAQTPATAAAPQAAAAPSAAQQQQGADQALFEKIAALAPPRQRPQAPAQNSMVTGLAPPPRAASAPGFNPQQQFGAPPLQPQLTGYQPQQQQMYPQQTGFQGQQQFPQHTGFQQGFQQQPPMPQMNGVQAVQQNFPALQPQPTGMAFQPQSQFGQQQAIQQYPQQTGFQQPQPTGYGGYQQVNGMQTGASPFADPPRGAYQPSPLQQSFAPPPPMPQQQQQPQIQGFGQQQPAFNISQPTGMNGYAPTGMQQQPQQQPQMPQLPPQQTGGVFGPSQPLTPLQPQKTGPTPPVRFGTVGRGGLVPQPTGRANLSKATPQNPFGF
ncbi:cytoskeletal protein binding protein [Recurvomyces mirabilis]|nr:cytoskeletal protein binding protein [Recurvomyces mirabilis]